MDKDAGKRKRPGDTGALGGDMNVDESKLNKLDRLGLAWCRFNRWEWDELAGPKPDGFDDLPEFDPYEAERAKHPYTMKLLSKVHPKRYAKRLSKSDFTRPALKGIEHEIGEANASRCWWIFELGRTEDEWRRWYCSTDRWSPEE